MDEISKFFKSLNVFDKSVFLSYEHVLREFDDDTLRDGGDGKTVQRVTVNDKFIVLKFIMPRGTVFTSNYHDCKEVINVIYGQIKWNEFKRFYNEFDRMVIPKESKHTITALKDTLAYSILYNPNETE